MENRFASIWNHVNEGILISDKSGKIVIVNPSCAALFGYSEDEILDIGIDALIPEAARSRHKKYREQYPFFLEAYQKNKILMHQLVQK